MSVFTKVSHAELQVFLERYPLGELLGFQGIGEGIENTNYFVDTTQGRCAPARLKYATACAKVQR